MENPSLLNSLIKQYKEGNNLTTFIKNQNIEMDSDLIEIIYDLQSGTYTEGLKNFNNFKTEFSDEIATSLKKYMKSINSMIDIGTGELTTLIPIISTLNVSLALLATDISWSRLTWAKHNASQNNLAVDLVASDMLNIPLPDNSVDAILTVHAMEPNGGKTENILNEFMRVTRKYLFLIEPDYEIASQGQRDRMERLDYITDLTSTINRLGLNLVEKKEIENNPNPLNCASFFVIEKINSPSNKTVWVCPRTKKPLMKNFDSSWIETDSGIYYPILKGIPLLRCKDAKYGLGEFKK